MLGADYEKDAEENEDLLAFAAELYDAAGKHYLLASNEVDQHNILLAQKAFRQAGSTIQTLAESCHELEAFLTYYHRAIDLYLRANDNKAAALCGQTLAETYEILRMYKQASEMYKKAGLLFENLNLHENARDAFNAATSNFCKTQPYLTSANVTEKNISPDTAQELAAKTTSQNNIAITACSKAKNGLLCFKALLNINNPLVPNRFRAIVQAMLNHIYGFLDKLP
jgi:tetratricopeptide (TPR) repeat protein